MEKLKVKEEPTIEKEILFKMEYFQFDEASKYIKNMVSSQGVVSVDFYNKVLLKAIQKNNVKLALEIFDFTRDAVQPNDTTYITLIEALLEKDRTNEAFGLFCQAYLQDQVLDLLVVERMLDAAKRARLPSTYITLLQASDQELHPFTQLIRQVLEIRHENEIPGTRSRLSSDVGRHEELEDRLLGPSQHNEKEVEKAIQN
jgi:hypothetical protein